MAITTVNRISFGSNHYADMCRYAAAPDKTSAYAAWIHGFHAHAVWSREPLEEPDPRPLHYVSAIGFADADQAPAVFRKTWDRFVLRRKGTAAAHIMQSFDPADVLTAETAHDIGRKLVRMLAPEAQAVIATHVDRPHLHNHLVVNDVLPTTGQGFLAQCAEGLYGIIYASNRLCDDHGLARQSSIDKERLDMWAHRNRNTLGKDMEYVRSQTADSQQAAALLRSFGHNVVLDAEGFWIRPEGTSQRVRMPALSEAAPKDRSSLRPMRNLDGLRFLSAARTLTPLQARTLAYLRILGEQRTNRRPWISFVEYKKTVLVLEALQYMLGHQIGSLHEMQQEEKRLWEQFRQQQESIKAKESRRRELHSLFHSACIAAFPGWRQKAEVREAQAVLAAGPPLESVREERMLLEKDLLETGRQNQARRKQLGVLQAFQKLQPQMEQTLQQEGRERLHRREMERNERGSWRETQDVLSWDDWEFGR